MSSTAAASPVSNAAGVLAVGTVASLAHAIALTGCSLREIAAGLWAATLAWMLPGAVAIRQKP